jgi:hypothetical protein
MTSTIFFDANRCGLETGAPRPVRPGLKDLLGNCAWHNLPVAVRERFTETTASVEYVGTFEEVRASALGRLLALAGRLLGTPVAPRTGRDVRAMVRVRPVPDGTAWDRCYCWSDGTQSLVRSVKVIDAAGHLIEKLPAHLCMPLEVYERGGVLHFQSSGYHFEFFRHKGGAVRLALPHWLSPGTTHVEHRDLGDGWFQFTLRVQHPRWGELFFQSGRFHAAGG